MSEDAIAILMMIFWAMVAYTVYLRFFVVRGLRKKVDKLADAVIARSGIAAPVGPAPEEERELRTIKERLRVLERIAVDKEDTLSREIEDLRAVSR
jgi:hypothetical protein